MLIYIIILPLEIEKIQLKENNWILDLRDLFLNKL